MSTLQHAASETTAAGSHDDLITGSTTATTDAAALPSTPCTQVLVQNDPDSAVNLFVGNATLQPLKLLPGAWITLNVVNLARVYHKTASGSATVNYVAR